MRGGESHSQEQKRSDRRKKRRTWLAVELLCALCALALLCYAASKWMQGQEIREEEQRAGRVTQSLATALATASATAPAPTLAAPGASEAPEAAPQVLAEYESLLVENPDFVGMLGLGDRTFYVCQADDNLFYMNHKFDLSEHPAGMIFMDCRNFLYPRSDNLILYGHNQKDGTRFGSLKRYAERDYAREYPVVRFTGLYGAEEYVPFAVFYASANPGSEAYFEFAVADFTDAASCASYVRAVLAKSVVAFDVSVVPGDALLTMATCSGELEDGMLIVVCRAVRESEREIS